MSKKDPEGVPANLSEEARKQQIQEAEATAAETRVGTTEVGTVPVIKDVGDNATEVVDVTPTPEEQEAALDRLREGKARSVED